MVTEIEMDENEYEEYLNESYGEVEVCGCSYPAGRVLREIDPIAFRWGLYDEPTRYKCDHCDTEYETEEEAEDCEKEYLETMKEEEKKEGEL